MQSRAGTDSAISRDAFFTRVVHQHARLLYRVAYSVLRHPEDAEDAVADTLLKLLRGQAWQTITNERAFLARAVWHTAVDRFAARPPLADAELEALDIRDRHPSPEDEAASANERLLLHALIDRLPADLRQPLLLSAIEDLNSREIGELIHLPEGTVRTRLMRARTLLREQFQQLQSNTRGREVATKGDPR